MTVTPELANVLREGRQAHVGVVSPHGPHVTPELYAWSGGRLWFLFAHTTLKARVLAESPDAAVLVSAGGRTVAIEGTVDLIDVRRPTTLLGTPTRGVRAARAVTGYAVRNAADLGAFVGDLATGHLGLRPPPARVLASLEPRCTTVIENGRITSASAWPGPVATIGAPAELRPGGEPVVVGFPGPRVVPGRWYLENAELRVDPLLLDLAEIGHRTPIAVVADEYVAPGPAAKVGTLLRGTAVRTGTPGWLSVEPDTLTSWDGIDTETHRAPDAEASAR